MPIIAAASSNPTAAYHGARALLWSHWHRLPKCAAVLQEQAPAAGRVAARCVVCRKQVLDFQRGCLAQGDPSIRVCWHQKDGFFNAALRGYRRVTQPLVFFTDSDGQYVAREFRVGWNLIPSRLVPEQTTLVEAFAQPQECPAETLSRGGRLNLRNAGDLVVRKPLEGLWYLTLPRSEKRGKARG